MMGVRASGPQGFFAGGTPAPRLILNKPTEKVQAIPVPRSSKSRSYSGWGNLYKGPPQIFWIFTDHFM
jgi:hypothetical protein